MRRRVHPIFTRLAANGRTGTIRTRTIEREGGYVGAHIGYLFGDSDFGLTGFPDPAFAGLIPPKAVQPLWGVIVLVELPAGPRHPIIEGTVTRGLTTGNITNYDSGVMREGTVVFLEKDTSLPEGTEVLVTPVAGIAGSPAAVLAALAASPRVPAEWVDELEQIIAQGRFCLP